jgi:hypothetical protein
MLTALALLSSLSLPQQSPPVEWRAVGPFRNRVQPGLVYDERRKRIVLFGGAAQGGGGRPNDMHEWDGRRWHRRRPKHMPFPNRGVTGKLAWDPVRKTALHFGGVARDGKTILNETWEYDGRDWTKLSPKTVPPKRFSHSMSYDPVRKQILMFGGANSTSRWTGGPGTGLLDDTWVWDGKVWKQLKTSEHYAGNATKRYGLNGAGTWPKAVAYDSDSQRLLSFHRLGGDESPEIFEFRVLTLETTQNYPRPGESFWFDVHLPSQAGNPFLFLFSGGPGPSIPLRFNAAGQVERLPLALDNLLVMSLSGAIALGLDGSGKGRIPFRIPKDKNLILFPFYAAGLTFDPKKNAVGRITNRVALEVSW